MAESYLSPFFKKFLIAVGRNGFGWRGRYKDWITISPQVSMLKSPDFKTNTGVL